MKHIRILHLYSNALDLYGDYKNLTVLQRRIAETGNTSNITEINLDEVIDPQAMTSFILVTVRLVTLPP